MLRDPLALAATIVALAALALWLADTYRWAARASATLLVIVFGAVLSNLGLVAPSSPVYDFLAGPATSLAIAWLLLAVDLRDLRAAGPRMLAAFGLAVGATVCGALTATALFPGITDGWKLAGVMTGTYSGGGLNFVAVGRAVELPPALFSAATAADNVMTTVWVGATLVLPIWLARWYPARREADDAEGSARFDHSFFDRLDLGLRDLGLIAAIGLGLVLAAERVAVFLPGPAIVWLTTLALAAGHLPGIRDLKGSLPLGTFALLLFFAVLGIGSRFAEILVVGVEVFYFTAIVVAVHGLLIYSLGRLARLDLETLSVASQAAVGGPPTAMALAVARERADLTLPGAAVGLLGYAVGNYAGLAVAALVRGWVGG